MGLAFYDRFIEFALILAIVMAGLIIGNRLLEVCVECTRPSCCHFSDHKRCAFVDPRTGTQCSYDTIPDEVHERESNGYIHTSITTHTVCHSHNVLVRTLRDLPHGADYYYL